ncbi:MAG: hypothetical protein OEV87_11130 [Phycisphaerae bacterium]|nr:hypothetical protein [Phycisphaerae bacterium]
MLDIGAFEHASFDYITTNSFLIYATTLFDCFLSETMTYLYFLYPGTLGSEKTYTFDMLLQAESKNKLVEDIIKEKVKKMSYRSFNERLLHLENTYGLKIELSESGINALNHYSSIRNVMVHNQGIYNITYNEDDEIEVEQYNCPIHPTPIEDRDLYKAFRIYIVIVGEIYDVINDKILKNSHSSIVTKTKKEVVSLIKTTFAYNINKKNFDSECYQKALRDLQDNEDYSDLARKAREAALVEFNECNKE